jgi:hypothetical protein
VHLQYERLSQSVNIFQSFPILSHGLLCNLLSHKSISYPSSNSFVLTPPPTEDRRPRPSNTGGVRVFTMLFLRQVLLRSRGSLPPRGFVHKKLSSSSSSSQSSQTTAAEDLTSLPPQKKGLLYRMAPPKGGTDPPDAKFLAIAAVVGASCYYDWFVDPPRQQEE